MYIGQHLTYQVSSVNVIDVKVNDAVERSVRSADPERAPQSLSESAYISLRDQLITLKIRPGEPIDEKLQASTLKIGRTPVREALKRLEADRLVVSYPRRGTFASDVKISDLALISAIRIKLEPYAAQRAAMQAETQHGAELRKLLEEIEAEPAGHDDADALIDLDLQVHRAIYRAAGNPFLEEILIRHYHLVVRIWGLFVDRLPRFPEHADEHLRLVQAILKGDANESENLARQHVLSFEAAIRSVI